MLSMDQYFILSLWLNSPLYGYYHILFIQMLMDIWVVLSFGYYVKSAAINICMQIWTPDFNSLGVSLGVRNDGSPGISMSFVNCFLLFQK